MLGEVRAIGPEPGLRAFDQYTQLTISAGSVSLSVFPPPTSHVTASVQVPLQ